MENEAIICQKFWQAKAWEEVSVLWKSAALPNKYATPRMRSQKSHELYKNTRSLIGNRLHPAFVLSNES